jgi:formamidopyrimidine-DNA glycosylase
MEAAMQGRPIVGVTVRRADLRRALPADFAARLTGRVVRGLRRRAKYLLLDLDDDGVLIIHLGMSGRISIVPADAAKADGAHGRHEHVVFAVGNGSEVRFSDPRRFGLMALTTRADEARHPLFAQLGPEPLDPAFDGAALAARLEGKRTPIKAALLDPRVVAGLGNIYVCESLFMAGISPRRLARTVQGDRADRLALAIHKVLDAAIRAGGSSLRDHAAPSGELGYFQHHFQVYDREGAACPHPGCGGTVRRLVQSGRSTFHCPTCQR